MAALDCNFVVVSPDYSIIRCFSLERCIGKICLSIKSRLWPVSVIKIFNSFIALCCYPNINSAIRNLGLNTPTAPIFLQFNYFRENIWVIIWVQFHFLYIFVGRVDRIHKTSHTRMLSFYFFASDL